MAFGAVDENSRKSGSTTSERQTQVCRWAKANECSGGEANLTAPAKTKPPLGRFFYGIWGRWWELTKKWFDHKRKADASMPVSFANERCGGVANLTAPAKTKPPLGRFFLWYFGPLMRTHERWFVTNCLWSCIWHVLRETPDCKLPWSEYANASHLGLNK